MQLSKRLEGILTLLSKQHTECLVDVGCDHGYVSMEAVSRGFSDRALACDINRGPLSIAESNISGAGLSDRVSTRLSDGLRSVDMEDMGSEPTLVCAGMGGGLIRDILSYDPSRTRRFSRLLLSPQSEPELVRGLFIKELPFEIRDELWLKDEGKFYVIIEAVNSLTVDSLMENVPTENASAANALTANSPTENVLMENVPILNVPMADDMAHRTDLYTEAELLFGRIGLCRRDPVLYEYLCWLEVSAEESLKKASLGSSDKARQRALELKRELCLIRDLLLHYREHS